MKMIRFKPECREWIRRGIKTTTFRRARKQGIYEVVEGSWFHPKRLGMFVKLSPIRRMTKTEVLLYHFQTEGDFQSSEQFMEWLVKTRLWEKLPNEGWLHRIEYLGENIKREIRIYDPQTNLLIKKETLEK